MFRYLCAIFVLVILTIGVLSPALATPNPFITPKSTTDTQTSAPTSTVHLEGMSFFSPILTTISQWQQTIRSMMTSFGNAIRQHPYGHAFWMFMLLGFIYGSLHAIGPGHGKLFAISYFMNRPGSLALAGLYGNMCMFFHVMSSAVLVLTGKYILETSMSGTVDDLSGRLETVSYALIAIIGFGMLAKTLWDMLHPAPQKHDTMPDPSTISSVKSLLLPALATGIVPCPGAALVLIFSITLGIQWAGLLALIAISLGMGLTLSAISIVTILSRGALLKLATHHEHLYAGLHTAIALVGSLVMTIVGSSLLVGHIGLV